MSTISNEVLAYLASLKNVQLELEENLRAETGVGNRSEMSEETCAVNEQSTSIPEDLSEMNEKQFEEQFVEDVRSYRCLWDTMSRGFKDTNIKTKAWDTLAEKYGKSGKVFIFFLLKNLGIF